MNCTPRGTLSRNKNKQQFLLEKKKSRNRTDFQNYTEFFLCGSQSTVERAVEQTKETRNTKQRSRAEENI